MIQLPDTISGILLKKGPLPNFFRHWLAWLLLHFITYIPTLINAPTFFSGQFFFAHFVITTINFLLFYLVAFFVAPLMGPLHKRWFVIVVVSLLLAILFTYVKFLLEVNRADISGNLSQTSTGFLSSHFNSYFRSNVLTNVSIVILALAYRILLFWIQQEKIRKELENQKLHAELSFLKMQVNPHFLFNALNNIYALAVLENGKKTGDSILKLSDLLRYVLYEKEGMDHKVSLQNEIRHINNYIDLERLRHEERIHILFSTEGAIEEKRIAPLLLFPLIENAFKHGILTDAKKPVVIEIKTGNGYLEFSVRNFKNSYLKDEMGGIGLQNVRKRLDLLYGDRYTIDIRDKPDQFFVNLHLPL